MHLCPENWVAIGRAVAYYAQVAHAFSAFSFLTLRTWSASYTLQVAALMIANLNFASEAKRKKRKN